MANPAPLAGALAQARRSCEQRSPASLMLVVAAHAALAWAALSLRPATDIRLPTPLQVSLISAESPQPAPAKPYAVPPIPVTPPARSPVLATPTDLPGTAPQSPQPAATAPAPAPTSATSTAPAVIAPRFDAAYLDNPAPPYPGLARRLGEEGRVLLRVQVAPDGSAAQVELRQSSGFARLDAAALETVRRWRFVPARQGGDTVAAWVLVPISFSLRS